MTAASILIVILLLIGLVWIYPAICLQIIAKKSRTPDGWMAWIPIINLILICRLARTSIWWTLLCLIPYVGLIFQIILAFRMPKCLGITDASRILNVIPIVNLFYIGYLAFGYNPVLSDVDDTAQPKKSDETAIVVVVVVLAVFIMVIMSGLMAAMAIPAFIKVRQTAQENVVMNNLRQIGAAADQYFIETGKTQVSLTDLVGPDNYIRQITPVDGENYQNAFSTINQGFTQLSISVPSLNKDVVYNP